MAGTLILNRKRRQVLGRICIYLLVLIVLAIVLLPFLWMVSGSFKTSLEIQGADVMDPEKSPQWFPRTFTLKNYIEANNTVRIFDYFKNSLIISIGTMISGVFLSVMAAYALSRYAFRGRGIYTMGLLMTQMFPGVLFLIPYFVLFVWVKNLTGIPLRDTYWGMILTYTSFALPFSVLMLRNYLESIPREIDEQAALDGCTPWGTLFRIILPLSKPGLAAVGIYCFIMAWNEVLFASVLTGQNTKTVSIGLLEYITTQQARWAQMMAACVIVSIPVLILFTLMQKQIVDGLVAGATKG
ncbi:MAG: carbohydrate ABC transporter permease [Bacillota bacterium]